MSQQQQRWRTISLAGPGVRGAGGGACLVGRIRPFGGRLSEPPHRGCDHDPDTTTTRRDAVLLAHLRAGHTPLLKAYANQLNMTVEPKCPSCGEEPQTVEHWLQRCPNAVALRQQLFGELSPPLSVLSLSPGSVLALDRKTLP